MTCVLLAAGYATRLYPLTKDFPKALLNVAGKTILDRVMENLENGCEADRYVIISNHRFAEHFRAWAEKAKYSVPVEVLDDGTVSAEDRLGAVGDLIYTIETLGLEDDLFVMAVDYFTEFALADFVKYFRRKQTSCVLRYAEQNVEILRSAAVMRVDGEGKVLNMQEKPAEPFDIWCAPPFYLYAKKDLADIKNALNLGCHKDAPGHLAAWLSGRVPVHAMEMWGERYDIGDLESYAAVCRKFETA